MVNKGSSVSAGNVINVIELLWRIKEGEIKLFAYDKVNDQWIALETPLPLIVKGDEAGLATETTLSGIKSQTDKLQFDSNRLLITIGNDLVGLLRKVDLDLDASNRLGVRFEEDNVGLAKETTLSGIKSQMDKLRFDDDNYLKTSPYVNYEVRDLTINSGEIYYVKQGDELPVKDIINNGRFVNNGTVTSFSIFDGKGIYDGRGVYS